MILLKIHSLKKYVPINLVVLIIVFLLIDYIDTSLILTKYNLTEDIYSKLSKWTTDLLFNQCNILIDALGITFHTKNNTFYFSSVDGLDCWLKIAIECTSNKLLIIWTIFIIFTRSSLKKKALFLPMGLMLIQLINITRIGALMLVLYYKPKYFQIAHDYVLYYLNYMLFFILCVLYMESTKRG